MYIDEQIQRPLVSVIMPAYNAQAYIEEAITSVLTQSVTDLELIVIDDCSQDETKQIAAAFAQRDSRVRLIANAENLGVARTRNRGLELCRGRYVALLDSDDYWEKQLLEKMLRRAEETGADIIYCSYAIVDEDGKQLCEDFIVPATTSFQESIVRSVITCSSVLITDKLAREHRFPTNMYHEDIALWFRILKDGGTARGVPEVLAAYRQRSDSRSADKIRSAIRRWPIYRKHLGMSIMQTVLALVKYGYYGLVKFRRI